MAPPTSAPARAAVGHLTVELDVAYEPGQEEKLCWLVERAVEQALGHRAGAEVLHSTVGIDPLP